METLQEYRCPCCGGGIAFDSHAQKMKCPYCDTEFDMETLAAFDSELQNDTAEDIQWEKMPENQWDDGEAEQICEYRCNSCGGQITGEHTMAATFCPYCGNAVVVTGKVSGSLKPDCVVPFKLDKAAAKAALKRHCTGKRLLPKMFQKEAYLDQIRGIYVPFWLFSADVDAHIRYRATRVRAWSDSHYHYMETSFFAVMRQGNIGFANVPVDGSSKMDDALMEALEPFDLSAAVDFQTAYLAGYLADTYDVDAQESIQRANQRIKQSTEDAFADTVRHYSSVTREAASFHLENSEAKYALLPVWILNTVWDGKTYTFAMNGQTGKMVGDLPMDKRAYRKWFFGLTGLASAAAFGLAYLIWLL